MGSFDIASVLPAWFHEIAYDASRHPGTTGDLRLGGNCQRFAYGVLRHFGLEVPPLWSSELWDHLGSKKVAAPFEPLDLLLFNDTDDSYGAHVAVATGSERALHLSRRVGRPVEWPIAQFADYPEYRVLIGGKRFTAE